VSEPRPDPVDPESEAPVRITRRDLWPLGLPLALGLLVRAVYLYLTELPPYDPWRHLLLVRNIREGAGFTLFDGQPYFWYSPVWYYLCAVLPRGWGMDWLAGSLSLLCVPLLYLLLLELDPQKRRSVAAAGALLMAASGPAIAFTCHYGPEAFALFLTLGALSLCSRRRGIAAAVVAGAAFGVGLAARMNFVFASPLFLPWIGRRSRWAGFLAAAAAPLALTWWRNHRIVAAHPFVFTWDGMATRSADFNPLSTLVVQLHPAVREGLRRLHEQVVPVPEWFRDPAGIAWGLLLFMLCGAVCLLACRRVHLILAGSATLGYFLMLDSSMSSNFFRIYLVLFPAFFLAVALTAGRLWKRRRRLGLWAGWGLVALMLLGGASLLRPPSGLTLELVTPPDGLLTGQAYMVNSSFYHPESLIFRYPEKRFVGMPLDPEQFEEFRTLYPGYDSILWHDFSVQDGLARYLREDPAWRLLRGGANDYGRRYVVLRKEPDGGDD
jgi:hypothetical protein